MAGLKILMSHKTMSHKTSDLRFFKWIFLSAALVLSFTACSYSYHYRSIGPDGYHEVVRTRGRMPIPYQQCVQVCRDTYLVHGYGYSAFRTCENRCYIQYQGDHAVDAPGEIMKAGDHMIELPGEIMKTGDHAIEGPQDTAPFQGDRPDGSVIQNQKKNLSKAAVGFARLLQVNKNTAHMIWAAAVSPVQMWQISLDFQKTQNLTQEEAASLLAQIISRAQDPQVSIDELSERPELQSLAGYLKEDPKDLALAVRFVLALMQTADDDKGGLYAPPVQNQPLSL